MDIEDQYDKIYRYCYFRVNHRQIAEDITQETFLRFFNQKLSLDSSKELPYLYTIARNLCIENYRKASRESLCDTNEEASYDPMEEWIDKIAIKTLITKLPQDEQELLLLRYANDVPIASISKITGHSRFSIYRQLSKILKWLKIELEKGDVSDE